MNCTITSIQIKAQNTVILFKEQQEIQLEGKLNVFRKPVGKEDRRLVWGHVVQIIEQQTEELV